VRQRTIGGAVAEVTAPVVVDDRIALGCARIPAGVDGSGGLGAAIAPVTIEPAPLVNAGA
jgi:hypothetical protein